MEVGKKKKIAIIGGVGVSIGVIAVLISLYNYKRANYNKRAEAEPLTKEEIRELEYDEYIRPNYNATRFRVIQASEGMRGEPEKVRLEVKGKYGRDVSRFHVFQAHEDVLVEPARVRLKIAGDPHRN